MNETLPVLHLSDLNSGEVVQRPSFGDEIA